MKIVIGLLLLATALAYPLAENEEKVAQPVIAQDPKPAEQDQLAAVPEQKVSLPEQQQPQKQNDPIPAQDSVESAEHDEIADKVSDETTSNEKESNEKVEADKKEEKKIEEPIKEPIVEDEKPIEPSSSTLKSNPAEPTSQPEGSKQADDAVAQIAAKSIPVETPEKPLALPTVTADEKPSEEAPKLVAAEIKEEIALPSEQKVEVIPAAEEVQPELKKSEEPVKIEAKSVAADEPVEQVAPAVRTAAEEKPAEDKTAKPEEIKPEEKVEDAIEKKAEEKLEEPKPTEAKPLEPQPTEVRSIEPVLTVEIKPVEKKPVEEPKPAEAKSDNVPLEQPKLADTPMTEQPKPVEEKLPEPSASSS